MGCPVNLVNRAGFTLYSIPVCRKRIHTHNLTLAFYFFADQRHFEMVK